MLASVWAAKLDLSKSICLSLGPENDAPTGNTSTEIKIIMNHRFMPITRRDVNRILLSAMPAIIAAFLCTCTAQANDVDLVSDGHPAAVIVLPDSANERSIEQQSADLLATFIQRMSGAELQIRRERELPAVEVRDGWIEFGGVDAALTGRENVPGESAVDQPDATNFILIGEGELARQLGVSADGLGPGGIRVKTIGNAVVLIGGPASIKGEVGSDSNGVQYAATELLERLGCHYLWPGELGLVVPHRPTVTLEAMDVSETPSIRGRGIRWGRLSDRSQSGLERLGMTEAQWQQGHDLAMGDASPISWSAWHRIGGRMPTFGHAGGGLRNGTQYLESHPEWFALQADGTRDQGGDPRWRLCVSNPELIEHVASDIIKQLNDNPNIELISLDPNDGGSNTGWCLCENCEALDPDNGPMVSLMTLGKPVQPGSLRRQRASIEHVSLTDRMVYYWNSIAERVTQEHPDVLFGVSAYSVFSHPPVERKLHPNMLLRYVPSHTDYVEGWKNAGAKRMFWRPNILLANRRDGKLRSIVGPLAENMRFFADAGIVQTDFDSINHYWSTLGVSFYAAARLVWDPYLSADQIIADFARHGFGAGAPDIEKYIHRVEALTEAGVSQGFRTAEDRRYTPDVLAELRDLLNRAERTADDSTISDRIAFLRMGLNYTELHETLDELAWRASDGQGVDDERVQRLIDLNALMLRDVILNHNLAINAPSVVWGSGTFAHLSSIGGRTVQPSDEAMLQRLDDPRYGLAGREDSLDEMLAAFGL